MSRGHLRDVEAALDRAGWVISEKLPGDDYAISATWRIHRPGDGDCRFLHFEGLDDMRTLPVEQSYGCHIEGHEDQGAYFARKGRSWPEELQRFERFLKTL